MHKQLRIQVQNKHETSKHTRQACFKKSEVKINEETSRAYHKLSEKSFIIQYRQMQNNKIKDRTLGVILFLMHEQSLQKSDLTQLNFFLNNRYATW